MTMQQAARDAHHDITWLVGALARALFERAEACTAVLPALEKVAACDFNAPLAPLTPALAPACRHLPQATIAAMQTSEEVAMALAASLEHLHWQGSGAVWAAAQIMGPDGPMQHDSARMAMLVAEAGAEVPLGDTAPLVFVLYGTAEIIDGNGALQHLAAGEVRTAHDGKVAALGEQPLLAALLHIDLNVG